MPNNPFSGNHMIQFPLGTMGVVWVGRLTGPEPQNLKIEWMPIAQIGRTLVSPQSNRNTFAEPAKFYFRRVRGAGPRPVQIPLQPAEVSEPVWPAAFGQRDRPARRDCPDDR